MTEVTYMAFTLDEWQEKVLRIILIYLIVWRH